MTARIKIDFVSDVSCPWCAVGLASLERALARLDGELEAEIHFQPFELNPDMPANGQDTVERLSRKYGLTPEQVRRNGEAITARGREVGFTFNMDKRTRTYNTFDAHRLLHWAGLEGHQLELKHALLKAYFTDGENPSDHDVLARLCVESGLDAKRAREILDSDEYAAEVRERERFYMEQGINSVPAVIMNDRHLIQGGQAPDTFERALRGVAGLQAGG
ncbi:disulfide bond formation protein DsbA [Pollutimonas subterranea]|uniref:Disulfide bond formation protein DsbA n=1 Tax=Pollutimonas subterranea TaxID=2045210 RepID=A0A2N4U7E9_9BURK|nr:DsbA family oxidoreductase [Pollutimonas subterranea]PLC50917.1 disulfide bond formation protein DsbA [Pollutimonas subterranea]